MMQPKNNRFRWGLLFVALLSPLLQASEIEPFAVPKKLDTEGFHEIFAQLAPTVYIAGQPTLHGLSRVQAMGVTRVINLRTHHEMDDREIVPFDESNAISELGMDYVHIPLGGPNTPYSPAAVDQFAVALESADGAVLLHCIVAWRATHMWTAYLVRHQDMSLAQAMAVAKQLNFGPLPLQGFLGQELTVEIKHD